MALLGKKRVIDLVVLWAFFDAKKAERLSAREIDERLTNRPGGVLMSHVDRRFSTDLVPRRTKSFFDQQFIHPVGTKVRASEGENTRRLTVRLLRRQYQALVALRPT